MFAVMLLCGSSKLFAQGRKLMWNFIRVYHIPPLQPPGWQAWHPKCFCIKLKFFGSIKNGTNFEIGSTRNFWEKLILRLLSCPKAGTENRVKYASNQKNKGTLFCQLFMKFDKMQSDFNFVHVIVSFLAIQIKVLFLIFCWMCFGRFFSSINNKNQPNSNISKY